MMIKLLLAMLFSASAHAAAAAPSPLVVVLSTQARIGANQRLSGRCAKTPFGVDQLLSNAALRSDLATCSADEDRDLMEYAVCRELQGAAGCAVLEGTKGSPAHCRAVGAEARFASAALRDGDAAAACRSMLELDGVRGPSVDKNCATMIKAVRGGIASTPCEDLAREKIISQGDSCEDIKAHWSGAPKDCDRFKDAGVRRECLSRAMLVAGLRNLARCPSSPACQALVAKAAGACDGLRAQFTRSLCGRVAKELAADTALDPKQRGQEEARAKEKAAKTTAAAIAKSAAAVAADQAKVDAIAAKAKAESLAEQQKMAKRAVAEAAKLAAAQAVVKTKADAEAAKDAKAKADIAKQVKPQFRKGAPMVTEPADAQAILKAVEEGRPLPAPKPKKIPKPETAPPDEQ